MKIEKTILNVLRGNSLENGEMSGIDTAEEDALFSFLQRNRLIPLFYDKIKYQIDNFSSSFTNRLKEANRDEMLRMMKMEVVFGKLIQLFAKNNIGVVVIKGFSLSAFLYKSTYLRPMSDLDFLVQPQQFEKALSVLSEAGATTRFAPDAESLPGIAFDRTFLFSGIKVELHHHLMNPSFKNSLDRKIIFRNTEEKILLGEKCQVLNQDMAFFYLLHHFNRHMEYNLARMIWLMDIHYYLLHYNLNWQHIFGLVKESNSSLDIYNALYLCQKLFDDEIPSEIPALGDQDKLAGRYLAMCREKTKSAGDVGSFKMISQIKGIKNKIRFGIKKLFPSAEFMRYKFKVKENKSVWHLYGLLLWQMGKKLFIYLKKKPGRK